MGNARVRTQRPERPAIGAISNRGRASPSPNSTSFEVFFDLDAKKAELAILNRDLSTPEVWQDQQKSLLLQRQKKRFEREVAFLGGLDDFIKTALILRKQQKAG